MKTFIILTILFSTWGFAQQRPVVINEEMTVNLVELDVKVQNLNGKYLSDINLDDFKVYENGDLQKISHFEEVDLMRLPEDEIEEYRSKIMILMDFQNSDYADMRKVFPELRKFFNTEYDGKSMIGMAINSGGIVEVLPFTTNINEINSAIDTSERLFKKALYKGNFFNRLVGEDTSFSNSIGMESGGISRHYSNTYYRNQIQILGQFLNYVSIYTGKKNIIMISGPWGHGDMTGEEGTVNKDAILSVRDIQTSCLFNKTSINVISLSRPDANITSRNYSRRDASIFDRTVEFASMSSGSFKKPANALISSSLNHTVDQIGRFYRIRYYSSIKKNKYRKIKVQVKGFNRIASTLSGYYPNTRQVERLKTEDTMNLNEEKSLTLHVQTDWMEWRRVNRKKIACNYAIAYRVYGVNGNLVAERVSVGEVESKKKVYPVLQQTFNLDLDEGTVPLKVQAFITDLTSGKQVMINMNNSAI